ncbi:hypothetical protein GY45DRAFT_1208360, partial [Cubamyces sp. BRFM 1775]
LAYVKWFSPMRSSPSLPNPNPDHGLHGISCCLHGGDRHASVMPIKQIEHSYHLIPDFVPVAP